MIIVFDQGCKKKNDIDIIFDTSNSSLLILLMTFDEKN